MFPYLNGIQRDVDDDGPCYSVSGLPETYVNGVPITALGQVAYDDSSAITNYSGGLPFTAAGRLATTFAAAHHHQNGWSFALSGRIARGSLLVNNYSGGLPFNNVGSVVLIQDAPPDTPIPDFPTGGDLADGLAQFTLPCNPSQHNGWLCQSTSEIIGGEAIIHTTSNQQLHDTGSIPAGAKTILINCTYVGPGVGGAGTPWSVEFYGGPFTAGNIGIGQLAFGWKTSYFGVGAAVISSLRIVGTGSTTDDVKFNYYNTFDGDRRAEFIADYGATDITP